MTVDAARNGRARPPAPGDGPRPFFRRHPVIAGVGGLLLALILAIVLFFWLANWNMLRGPIGRFASARAHRHIEIDGDLKVHLLTWTPTVSIGELRIAEPGWAGPGDMADVGRVVVSVRLLSLLTGHVVFPLIEIDNPNLDLRRDAEGRANWDFGPPKKNARPFRLPPIQHFAVVNGRLRYADAPRKLQIRGLVSSNESASGAESHAFSLRGDGSINAHPFRLEVAGGPLLNVDLSKPYPFRVDIRAGATHVTGQGQLAKPFDTARLNVHLTASGADLANLYELTGLALPNTPPYTLSGDLTRDTDRFDVDHAAGRFGASDVEGRILVTVTDHRPFVDANLRSRVLDIRDLASLLGAKPAASRAAGAGAPSAAHAGTGRILPDAPLDARRIKGMDARLIYRAAAVNSGFLPIRGASLDLSLKNGVLNLDPVAFSFPQGRVFGTIRLDANPSVPLTSADIRVSNLNLDEIIPRTGAAPPIEGLLAARLKLEGRGASVHAAAGAANGAVTFVVPNGRMRQAFAELLGVNAGKGLSMLLSKNNGDTGIRCGVADFLVRNGVMQARNVVFDTDVVKVNGAGDVNLGTEQLQLTLKGESKRFRIGHVFLPITLGGMLGHPQIGVQPGPAIAQGAAAAALGVVLTPFAAIIPFVDPGLAKGANCAALMGEARSAPAPIAPSQAHGLHATPKAAK